MTAIHPEDRETASKSICDGIRSGQDFTMEARFRRAQDGAYRWHLNRAAALRDAEGNLLRFVCTSTDIEDQKQSQENLRRAVETNRLIVDTALDAVITMDAEGAITDWNKQAEMVFGWSNTEAIGQHMSDLIIPERLRMAHERGLRHFLATGNGPILRRRIEVTAVRRNGVQFPAELEDVANETGPELVFWRLHSGHYRLQISRKKTKREPTQPAPDDRDHTGNALEHHRRRDNRLLQCSRARLHRLLCRRNHG